MSTRELLLTWDSGLAIPLLCIAALAIYFLRFGIRPGARAAYFVAAVALFLVALASPIGVLARGYLFSAHMLQHLLLLLAVPPLVLLSLPRQARSGAPEKQTGALGYAAPWLAGTGAMWVWHQPALCNLAAGNAGVQWIQTASLLGLGLVFWRPVLSSRIEQRFEPFPAILYLFAACVGCSVLGIVVTFSPVEVCDIFLHPVDGLGVLPLLRDRWGLTRAADQQLGGLMMWVPACMVYTAAILSALARYYQEEGIPPFPAAAPSVGVK